jgi:hypothetical protein
MKNFLKLLLILYVLFSISSCSKDNDELDNSNLNGNQLDDKTLVLNSETDKLLTGLSENNLVFSSSNDQIKSIEVGSILASDITNNAPNGYLRRVVSIDNTSGNTIINTVQASLTEAIKNVDFSYNYSIGNENIIDVDSSGVDILNKSFSLTKNRLRQPAKINIPFKKFEIYKIGQDIITISGNVELSFDIDFDLKIKDNSLEKLRFVQNVTSTANLTIDGEIGDLPNFHAEKILKTFTLLPITIPILPPFVLPVAKQYIVIVVGLDGEISAGFTVGANNVFTSKAGIIYENGSWSTIDGLTNNLTPFTGEVYAKGEIKGWVKSRYEVRPYGLDKARMFIEMETGPKLSGGISTANPDLLNLDLDWCFEIGAGVEMEIFGTAIADYNDTFFENCFDLTNWSNSTIDAGLLIGTWEQIGGSGSPGIWDPSCPVIQVFTVSTNTESKKCGSAIPYTQSYSFSGNILSYNGYNIEVVTLSKTLFTISASNGNTMTFKRI